MTTHKRLYDDGISPSSASLGEHENQLTVSTVGVLSDFSYSLESDAEQRDGADLAQQTCSMWHATGFLPRDGEVGYRCRYCDGVGQV